MTLTVTFFDVTFGEWLHIVLANAGADMAACFRARLEGQRDWSLLGRLLPPRAA